MQRCDSKHLMEMKVNTANYVELCSHSVEENEDPASIG